MKKLLFPLVAISITLFAVFTFQNRKPEKSLSQPKPTNSIVVDKESGNEQELRRQWIEQMHKAAPGVNWRAVNYQNRLEKFSLRNSAKNITSDVEIAGGLLTGYWRETGSNNLAGRTHLVEYDFSQDSIYCASSGGNIWKADKEGNGWRVLNDYFQIDNILMIRKIDHNSGKRLLVANGGWGVPGFLYSDNDGQTWSEATGLSSIASWGYVIRSVVANNAEKTIYLLAMEWDYTDWEKVTTVYVSENHGQSFTKKLSYPESIYGDEGFFDIWCAKNGSETVYLLENANVSSFNSDYSLTSISSIPFSATGSELLKGTEIAGVTSLYVAVSESEQTTFYQSNDGGATWSAKGSVPQTPFFKSSFEVSAVNSNYLYFGGVECYRSWDGAQTWTKINNWGDYYSNMSSKLHADIPSINSFKDELGNEFVYVNTDGGTYISYNSLASVQNISLQNLKIGQLYSVYSHRTNSNVIFAGSQDQGYQLCTSNDGNNPEDFTQVISGDYGHIVSSDGGNSVWMVYPGFAAYYPNAVTNPGFSDWWDFECSGQFWIPPLMADPNAPNIVYLGGGTTSSGTHLFKITSYSGWVDVDESSFDFSGTSGSTNISAIACSPIDHNYRYVMNGNGEFFTSTDGGANWTLTSGFDGPDGNYLYGAAIVPSKTQLGKVYLAGSGYSNPGAYVSNNNGLSFSPITTGLPNTMTYELAITDNDEFLFAATDNGPYVYIPSENRWYDLAAGFAPDQTYWSVDYNPATQTVRFGTYGRGIWDFVIESGLVNIANRKVETKSFVYPNPANEFIWVDAEIGSVVKIYSLNGQLKKVFKTKNSKSRIDVSDLEAGSYLISEGSKTETIVISK